MIRCEEVVRVPHISTAVGITVEPIVGRIPRTAKGARAHSPDMVPAITLVDGNAELLRNNSRIRPAAASHLHVCQSVALTRRNRARGRTRPVGMASHVNSGIRISLVAALENSVERRAFQPQAVTAFSPEFTSNTLVPLVPLSTMPFLAFNAAAPDTRVTVAVPLITMQLHLCPPEMLKAEFRCEFQFH
jgi:hypothetical protein